MRRTVGIIGTLDTKGDDFAFLRDEIAKRGCDVLVVDTAVVGDPAFEPDVSREEVARAGGVDLARLVEVRDRGEAVGAMARGAAEVARRLYEQGRIHGIIGMGGGAGTLIGSSAMRALPVGVPKLLVSTVASGDVAPYVGISDVTMMHSVVDVSGVNSISRKIYTNAAAAIAGMVLSDVAAGDDKPIIGATMFGNTTRAVNHARGLLEAKGYEVLVFHATGAGGRSMEALIDDGHIAGVLDMTTTEWADELCGGVLTAGPHRLEAAGRAGIPQVVVPGCLDMCNFWARPTVPERYKDRTFYEWNPNITLMRTTVDENRRLGDIFAEKLNAAKGPVEVLVPMRGLSEIDLEGKPFHLPEANEAFVESLRAGLRPDIEIRIHDTDINDPAFATAAVETLVGMLQQNGLRQQKES
jgi:uncharacterized protein (UPF0261 family)